jgi:hypothetical protein
MSVINPDNRDATLAIRDAITCIPITIILPSEILVQVEEFTRCGHLDTAVHERLSYPTHEGEVLSRSNGWIPRRNIDVNTTGVICNTERKADMNSEASGQ